MQESKGGNNARKTIVFGASILAALITFLIYLPSLKNGFVSYDDPIYITHDLIIRSLDLRFLKGALTETVSHNWHPLTILSCAVDYAMWGLDPRGYHLTNIILHALNTFLTGVLAAWLYRLYRRENTYGYAALTAGAVAALLFGLHPLHVESVTWISERKDVLSAFFFLLSVLSYLAFATGLRKSLYYSASLGFFFLALLSKPMVVTLPVVLLILDYCPLERLGLGGKGNIRAIVEKVPFFALSGALGIVTLLAQRGAMASLEKYRFSFRLGVALRSYVFYLYKTILPLNLAPYYDRPPENAFFYITVVLSVLLLVLITALTAATSKRGLRAAWLYFLVTLLPVTGIIQVGAQAAADRYMYLPSLGPFVVVGAAAAALIRPDRKAMSAAVVASMIALFSVMSVLTVGQEAIWKNTLTLWSHELTVFPGKIKIAYNSRGGYYLGRGDYDRALDDLNAAISLDPKYALAYNNRGLVYKGLKDYRRAIEDFSSGIALDPKSPFALLNRGDTYRALGDDARALEDYNAALRLDPGNPELYNARGVIYAEHGDLTQALNDYSSAISLDPAAPLPYNNRGGMYARMKEFGPAIRDFDKAIALKPDLTLAYKNRAKAYMEEGRYDRAVEDLGKASVLSPGDPSLYLLRGLAYMSGGDYASAAEDLNHALRVDPKLSAAYYYLGISYYRTGQTGLASQYLKKASLMGVKEAREFMHKQKIK